MISTVLISWNTRDLLDACLQSLHPQVEDVGGDVWVVDNNSHDRSADMVAGEHPWVQLVRNNANVGFARACNLVFPKLTLPYVFLFNPDATLEPGSLRAMRAIMESHPKLGALMPQMLNAEGRPTHFVGRAPRLLAAKMWLGRRLVWKLSHVPAVQRWWEATAREYLGHSPTEGLFPREQMEGAALMLRRTALEQVGPFDPGFFCGWEETDLTIRLREAGWELAMTPAAGVRHWDQQSRLQWKSRPWEIADGYYFARKHGGKSGLLRHAMREERHMKYHAMAGGPVEQLRAEHQRVLKALTQSPEHPGYGEWTPDGAQRAGP